MVMMGTAMAVAIAGHHRNMKVRVLEYEVGGTDETLGVGSGEGG
jgi:hypothetical protein